MKCKTCNQEMRELKGEWIKFKKLGIEVNFEQEQDGKKFEDLIIPKDVDY